MSHGYLLITITLMLIAAGLKPEWTVVLLLAVGIYVIRAMTL